MGQAYNFDRIFDDLWPICRSITGNGLRSTLGHINKYVPIEICEYKTGTQCFDWEIPMEWNVKDAWIKDLGGNKLVDFSENNLHLLNYSIPKKGRVSQEILIKHLHTLPDLPQAIPYRTSYYNKEWGFCVAYDQYKTFTDEEYEIFIDTTLDSGHISIGEGLLKGRLEDEILFTTYTCHPSMANNELSGILVQTDIFSRLLKNGNTKYSYRFVYAPETIGDIVYLSHNRDRLSKKMIGGAVLSMLGNDRDIMYEPSSTVDSIFDRASKNVLNYRHKKSEVRSWNPKGRMAQRQYCSPGLRLPLSVLSRGLGGDYPEYHTSLDTKGVIRKERYEETVEIILDIINLIEINDTYINTKPYGEPFLTKYNLGTKISGRIITSDQYYYKVLLQMSDGSNDLIDIANMIEVCAIDFLPCINDLWNAGLLKKIS
jgi:aminopeptidase-like protein